MSSPVLFAGEDKVPPGAAEELLKRARRFVPCSNGPTDASGGLLAEHLTDWLIVLRGFVLASDAVSTATAESAAQVSGKARLRLSVGAAAVRRMRPRGALARQGCY